MMTKEELESRLAVLEAEHGAWTYDIPLPHGVWTNGNRGLPHTRLKRMVQIVRDLSTKPIADCRILDLGCLDGLFSIEFALQGARVTGVDIRGDNVEKACFAGEALELEELRFIEEDVRDLSSERHGRFDVILCSGLLYHLDARDAGALIGTMYEMVEDLVIIDTHISLRPRTTVKHGGREYHGHLFTEHARGDSERVKSRRLWASSGNDASFWFTRESLVNCLAHAGFSSIHECFTPPHLNFGRPGLESDCRCTFVAVKGRECELHTSPAANGLREDWPEGALSYGLQPGGRRGSRGVVGRVISRLTHRRG